LLILKTELLFCDFVFLWCAVQANNLAVLVRYEGM